MRRKSDKAIIFIPQTEHSPPTSSRFESLIEKELYRNWVRDVLEPVVYILLLLVDRLQLSRA